MSDADFQLPYFDEEKFWMDPRNRENDPEGFNLYRMRMDNARDDEYWEELWKKEQAYLQAEKNRWVREDSNGEGIR